MTGQELLSTYKSELNSLTNELKSITETLESKTDFDNMNAKIEEIKTRNAQFVEDSKTAIW